MVAGILPSLVEALQTATANAKESWLASSALELIVSVLEGAEKGNLGEGLVPGLAPVLFDCLAATEDREVMIVRLKFSTSL